jgi:hypothetical protein
LMNVFTNHVYTNSCVGRVLMSMPLVKNILKSTKVIAYKKYIVWQH